MPNFLKILSNIRPTRSYLLINSRYVQRLRAIGGGFLFFWNPVICMQHQALKKIYGALFKSSWGFCLYCLGDISIYFRSMCYTYKVHKTCMYVCIIYVYVHILLVFKLCLHMHTIAKDKGLTDNIVCNIYLYIYTYIDLDYLEMVESWNFLSTEL